jgi:hypothetical protein
MDDFDILLSNGKGQTLPARVKYLYPDQYIVEIHQLKLTLNIKKDSQGNFECVQEEELHSILVKDVCIQINALLNN